MAVLVCSILFIFRKFCNNTALGATNQKSKPLISMKYPFRKALFAAFVLAANMGLAQTTDNASLYTQFDNRVGKNNLGLNNGTVHLNNMRSADDTNRYYPADRYSIGTIVYDGQPYTGVSLKYDILKDVIIAKTPDEKSNLGINLITEKTQWFTLDGKKFVNLNYDGKSAKFSGYYEADVLNNQMTFYTKYRKDNVEVLRHEGVFYKYVASNTFVFGYQNQLLPINSKSDAVRAFPQLEKNISEFFERNTALERSDKKLFFMTLLKQLHNSLP